MVAISCDNLTRKPVTFKFYNYSVASLIDTEQIKRAGLGEMAADRDYVLA